MMHGRADAGSFEWIRNLTGFFLFMSVMDHLMPEKAYASYIRLFSGMVFILLVLQPITGNRKLEERIAQYYESNLFRYETGELRENLLGVEEKRRTQMVNQYEEALSQEISKIAQADGFEVRNCRVKNQSGYGLRTVWRGDRSQGRGLFCSAGAECRDRHRAFKEYDKK